ncbi:MAG: aspartate aminotransferase family protein [Actinobacteria bacterium]|nr:aspartate aminotransferase family protein [Actinomycetota bacterium]MBL7060604.1 aspartate aminotransferase family protein [Actinomycetota bacterium]
MDKNLKIYNEGSKYLMNTYSRLPVVFVKGEMQYLWDANGQKYLDFVAGYGCLNVGHSNKFVMGKLKKQIDNIIQSSNVYHNKTQVELAKKLCNLTNFGGKVFFANSGTEAIEGAIKLARKFSKNKYNPDKYRIISFYKSFHGRTLGALSATAQTKKQEVFKPLVEGFDYARLNDIDSVKGKINKNTCAILIEPIQGEGGININDKKFLTWIRKICSENKILLILDEVQTGFGRTGEMFAYQNYGIKPDIMVVAKSLGGGMPIGAIISTDDISSAFNPGDHGSTFGGNAASCAAGCAVIDYILKNGLIDKSREMGKYFLNKLKEIKKKYTIIKDVRGIGLMLAMEFKEEVADILVRNALKDYIILNKVSDSILRFLPPLMITKDNINTLMEWLDKNIGDLQK